MNLMAKLRFFNVLCDRQVLLILRSLSKHGEELLTEVRSELVAIVIENIDRAMTDLNSNLMQTTIDMALVLSSHIKKTENVLPESDPMVSVTLEDIDIGKPPDKKDGFPNLIRMLIMRLAPYISAQTKPLSVAVKALKLFEDLSGYLANRELLKETKSAPFESEDADNVKIPCALSAITYELYPKLMQILKQDIHQAIKLGVIAVFQNISEVRIEFLLGMKRYESDIAPLVSHHIAKASNQIDVKVLKSFLSLLQSISSCEAKVKGPDLKRY